MDRFFEANLQRYRGDLDALLRIPSISSLPEHAPDVRRAAEWVAARLTAAGMEHVQFLETGGHPVVYGDLVHARDAPTVLVYGHFDVQPVDPLDLWNNDPFEPAHRDGRVYARGASDMKANLLVGVEAVEAVLQTSGSLPVNVKFFLEGQEEIGSPQLPATVVEHRDLLTCDLVISGDGLQWSDDQPMVVLGMRGGCGLQIDVRGAGSDLHSGLTGGAAPNPIHALVRLLDSLHAPDGSIAVDGFYDDVVPLGGEDRAAIAAVPFDEEEYRASLGARGLSSEPGYSVLERLWVRPTLELNGIWGGFQGEGVKTVIPAEAHAKITCRLVPWQDPRAIVERITQHVARHAPPEVEVVVTPLPFVARPYLVPADFWGNRVVAEALAEAYGQRPLETRVGGSVPVCELFLTNLGAYTVSLGFGREDEGAHAPDEFVRLNDIDRGRRIWADVLHRLAREAPGGR